jgi:hypothetical protein
MVADTRSRTDQLGLQMRRLSLVKLSSDFYAPAVLLLTTKPQEHVEEKEAGCPPPELVLMFWIEGQLLHLLEIEPRFLGRLAQRFPNFFQVGTTFISQNVLRTTVLLSPLKANYLRFSTTVCDTQFTLILFFLSFLD